MGINVSNLVVDLEETTGNIRAELSLVAPARLSKLYVDKKPTDTIDGVVYTVISPSLAYDKLSIKVKETIPSVEFTGKPVRVHFNNLDGKIWQDFHTNEIKMSLTADSIEIVENKLKVNRGEKANEV